MNAFTSSRDNTQATFTHAIFHPNASNSGLWCPKSLPQIDFQALANQSYTELVHSIFAALNLDISPDILDSALSSYKSFDDSSNPAPITTHNLPDNLAILELYHGSSRAFKDMALAPFGALFSTLAKKHNKKYLILAATSGDTGPATLDSFEDKENISVICLYPKGGTSDVQELQMITKEAKNLHIFGINGNFDDAQSALKSLIHNPDFQKELEAKDFSLSVANSINFGRIAFQIIYHIWGYFCYLKAKSLSYGTPLSPIIPSGNFGNALGAFYAKRMGLPLGKIIIASNPNHILTDFISTGTYDLRGRKLILTHSPAMDILKSSNVERVLFELFGFERTKELMQNLDSTQTYSLSPNELATIHEYFQALFCPNEACLEVIKNYAKKSLLLDPHTANAIYAYEELNKNTNSTEHFLAYSTAQWCKFAPTMLKAITGERAKDFEAIQKIESTFKKKAPSTIHSLLSKPIKHSHVLSSSPDEIRSEIIKIL